MRHIAMAVFVRMNMLVLVAMFMRQVHVKLRARNRSSFLPRHMEVVFAQSQLLQLVLELVRIHAQVQHRANEHVTADAAKNIKVECFHG
jgi:hypothetical protein